MQEYKTRCKQYALVNILTDKIENNKGFSYIDIYGINGGGNMYKRFDNFETVKKLADKKYTQEMGNKNQYTNYAILEEWCIKRKNRNKVIKSKIVYCANKNFIY